MKNIHSLLDNVTGIIASERENCSPHCDYDLFKILEIGNNEVIMCRFLSDLLNPYGMHGCGSRFLKSFLESLCGIYLDDSVLNNTVVTKEYHIDEKRRIDIVIQNSDIFLPVEVKIYAGDQKSQCFDYYEYAGHYDRSAKLIYLTRFGDAPSNYSLTPTDASKTPLSTDKIICLSFARDIYGWLSAEALYTKGAVHFAILHYLAAIRAFTNNPEVIKMKTAEVISQSEVSLLSALKIKESLVFAMGNIIRSLFVEIEEQMKPLTEKYGLDQEKDFLYYTYMEQTQSGFDYPGINYVVKNVRFADENIQLWMRIEVHCRLSAGFCLFNRSVNESGERGYEQECDEALKAEVKSFINAAEFNSADWWVLRKYLPTGQRSSGESVPDFSEMNGSAIALADEAKRHEFVKRSVTVIESALLKLLKV